MLLSLASDKWKIPSIQGMIVSFSLHSFEFKELVDFFFLFTESLSVLYMTIVENSLWFISTFSQNMFSKTKKMQLNTVCMNISKYVILIQSMLLCITSSSKVLFSSLFFFLFWHISIIWTWWFNGKESACNEGHLQETWFWSLDWKIPWRRKWQPTPVFLPENLHGQRSLVGYKPLGLQRIGHDYADTARHNLDSFLPILP